MFRGGVRESECFDLLVVSEHRLGTEQGEKRASDEQGIRLATGLAGILQANPRPNTHDGRRPTPSRHGRSKEGMRALAHPISRF